MNLDEMPFERRIWFWPMTWCGIALIAGSMAFDRISRRILWKNSIALRQATTRKLIQAGTAWHGPAGIKVSEELTFRAAHKDRVARAYLHGLPFEHLPAPDLSADSRPEFGRRSLRIYSPFSGMTTVCPVVGYGSRLRPFLPALILLGLALKDARHVFEGTRYESWGYGAALVGSILSFGGLVLIFRDRPSATAKELAGISTRQLIFVAINGDRGLRSAAARHLQERFFEEFAAKQACHRLGLVHPNLPVGEEIAAS